MRNPAVPISQPRHSGHDPSSWGGIVNSTNESIQERIERVRWDIANLEAFYKVKISTKRSSRLKRFFRDELEALDKVRFNDYDQEAKVDYLLLRSHLKLQLQNIVSDEERDDEVRSFLGDLLTILVTLIEARQSVDPIDGQQAAQHLTDIVKNVQALRVRIEKKEFSVKPVTAYRATKAIKDLRSQLQEWKDFYKDYDPLFTWWISEPYPSVDNALSNLSSIIKKHIVGLEPDDQDTIIGEPIGRSPLLEALESESIPYTPEELIEIGKSEYEWCETEMKKASTALGYDNWRDALEHVKNQYLPPDEQPKLIRHLTNEATSFVKKHDLVTVPEICEETWEMFMMSPERQKMNPFFLGGESIIVSYPTSTMAHDDKLMSMRGNNIHFSRATVFHEMIPGHHLHMHCMQRIRPYRQMFFTPFCTEGWAFYWEMILWDKPAWHKTPENRIGMLFWRMHRCARIVFSLKYHLGQMTAQECIDLLVDWVGHERATAEGEVRRSIMGDYGPLYQAGYMLGGLQLYALRKEVVDNGTMSEKEFHDAFLRANQMPVELFRALLLKQELSPDFKSSWKFYE